MVWPFSKKPALTPEQADRCRRRCGMGVATLAQCLAANPGSPDVCRSLETQVVHCHSEVVCPELAAAHQRCFQRVVNSKGRQPYSACAKEVDAMKACLKRLKLFPFDSSIGSHASGGPGGSRPSGRAS